LPTISSSEDGDDGPLTAQFFAFILSLSSGKRNVIVDGREVHYSQAGSWERSFDFPFSVPVADVGSVHARVHLIADSAPGARPYDLLINEMSYTLSLFQDL
jgi:hypothetical protein